MITHKERYQNKAMESVLHAAATEFDKELSAAHKLDALRFELISQATHKNGIDLYKYLNESFGASALTLSVPYILDLQELKYFKCFGLDVDLTEIK